jgi:serine/threonine protein kinase
MSVVSQSSASIETSSTPKLAVPHIGSLVGGRYRVTCRLAEGTFGHTYLAKDTHLPNSPECVIKQLKVQTNQKAMEMARRLFETEARILYKLGTYDQIPQLLAHFEQDDGFFLSQEYIDGYPISDELSPDRPWADVNVVRLIREILEVLAFVHQQQVIHRDIKPSNLIRRKKDGKIVLIDFGAVKEVTTRFLNAKPGETDYTIAIGTFGYIPKEQLGGRPRFSSDIFSVGMIAIQALTGVHPNDLVEDDSTAELQWRDRLPAPINPEFANIIDRMIRYDFRERYATAEAALQAIETLPVAFREAAVTPPWHFSEPGSSPENLSVPPTDTWGSRIHADHTEPVGIGDSPSAAPASPVSRLGSTQFEITPGAHAQGRPQKGAHVDAQHVETFSNQSTFPLNHTHMTNVVAPSFSNNTPMTDKEPPRSTSEPHVHGLSPAFSQVRLSRKVTTWKERVVVTSERFEHWLSHSWRVIVWIGGTSLTLMLARGMMASLGVQPANQLQSDVFQTVQSEAEQLLPGKPTDALLMPGDADADMAIDVATVLVDAHKARINGNYQEAMDLYQHALGQEPNLVAALWGKCATHNAQGQFELASTTCYEALAIAPDDPLALWNSAEANDQLGNHRKAAEERSRALALDPDVAEKLWAISADM